MKEQIGDIIYNMTGIRPYPIDVHFVQERLKSGMSMDEAVDICRRRMQQRMMSTEQSGFKFEPNPIIQFDVALHPVELLLGAPDFNTFK